MKTVPDNRTSQGCEIYWELLHAQRFLKPAHAFWCWKYGIRNLTIGIKFLKHVKGYLGPTWRRGWLWIDRAVWKKLKYGEVWVTHFSFSLLFLRGKRRWGRLGKKNPEKKGGIKTKASFVQNQLEELNIPQNNNCRIFLFSLCMCKTLVKDPPRISVCLVPSHTLQTQYH